ncbi:polysialyltransferase family glycosyltransferase [Hyunsoonleella ulvae]|uniref:polysialyltransferase family glycosyltransferase n=1 Tax=Hyunsoonleella ulvae TaxID=2799948 RepID=UPI00193A9DC8|nr:polysialyltransferase family glycosyltransferase [Hyunsoonleella ulvae]
MRKDDLNIFVSIAPSHIGNFEKIIKSTKASKRKNILINAGDFKYDKKLWDNVITGKKDLRLPSGSLKEKVMFQKEKIKFYKVFIERIKETLPPSDNIDLYYCNLEDILNNYFFFGFKQKALKNKILVEDGILNYYDYRISKERYLAFLIKFIWCKLLGVKYKLIFRQLSGIDRKDVLKQYVRYPEYAIFPEKAVLLQGEKINYLPIDNVVLLIGQDILEDVIGISKYNNVLDKLLEKIKQVLPKDSTIIYKPHRNGDYKIAYNKINKLIDAPVNLIIDDTPVEELIVNIKPSIIISFFSTSLLNLKLNVINPVDIYFMPLSVTNYKIVNLFQKLGIKNLSNV